MQNLHFQTLTPLYDFHLRYDVVGWRLIASIEKPIMSKKMNNFGTFCQKK